MTTLKSISAKYGQSLSRMAGILLTVCGLVGMVVISLYLFKAADTRLERAQELSLVALPYSVWNYDEVAVGQFLDAIIQDPEFEYMDLKMDGQIFAARPDVLEGSIAERFSGWQYIIRDFAIYREGEEIARVALVQSRADLWLTIGATLLAFVAVIIAMLVLIIRRSIRLTERLIFLPLQSLETAASRMAAGNLEQKLDTSGDDEIASLTRSLDAMRGSISSLFGKLNHANQELSSQNHVLEEKVRERTVELERLNARLNSENIRMGAELDVTRQLQEMVLPREDELSTIEGLEISTHVEPAHEVGGDYLDVLSEGGRVRIGIGDVTGHGLDSGVLMLLTQSAVRTLNASEEADLLKIVNVLNRSLTGNINRMGSGKNLSFALLDYHLEQGPAGTQGLLNIVGQHESILICRANGTLEEIDTLMLGMPLGLVDDVGEYLAQEQIILAPGDIAVLYTDGITEAADAKGTLFGMPQLQQAVVDNHALSAPEIKQAVVARVKEHIGDQELLDDLTLLIIKQAEVAAAA